MAEYIHCTFEQLTVVFWGTDSCTTVVKYIETELIEAFYVEDHLRPSRPL